MQNNPLAALIILDGYALRDEEFGNAVKQAHTPNFDRYWKQFPTINTQVFRGSGWLTGRAGGKLGSRPFEYRCRSCRLSKFNAH